jgi:transposase-like protein
MPTPRRSYSAEFKAKLALDAIKGRQTINELATEHGRNSPAARLRPGSRRRTL